MRIFNNTIKRIFDVVISLFGVLILLPLLFLVAVLIKITMPGPIIFKQQRVGKKGVLFNIIKFRSMSVDIEDERNYDFSKDEDRIKPLGKLLRRTKVDEIPQLINVIKGDMSLVGPRPTVQKQVEKYNEFQTKRLVMRPGITGLAQVNGNITLPWETRINYDIEYIENFNFFLDCKILIKTILIIIFGEEKFKKTYKRNPRKEAT